MSHRYLSPPTPSFPLYSSGLFQSTVFGCSVPFMCKPAWWFTCRRYSVFYIPHMKIWVQVFHMKYEICITFNYLAVYFWSWYMDYCMFHMWISVYMFSAMNIEFCYSHKKIWAHNFLLEIWKFIFHKWATQLNFLKSM